MSYSERIRRLARTRLEEDPAAEARRYERRVELVPIVIILVIGMVLLASSIGLIDPDPMLNALQRAWIWLES